MGLYYCNYTTLSVKIYTKIWCINRLVFSYQSTVYCVPLRGEVIHLQRQGAKIQKRNNAWKTQGSIMQDLLQDNEKRNVKRHMKVHEKPNKQICGEVLDGILDKMFVQEESTTEIKHDDGEHDTANCQPSKKIAR